MQNLETTSRLVTLKPKTLPPVIEAQIAVATRLGTQGAADASVISVIGSTTTMEGFAVGETGTTTTVRSDAAEGQIGISVVKGAVVERILSILTELQKTSWKMDNSQTESI